MAGVKSNPTTVSELEETLRHLKKEGATEVYVEVKDPDNILFTSIDNPKLYCFCYSSEIHKMKR